MAHRNVFKNKELLVKENFMYMYCTYNHVYV